VLEMLRRPEGATVAKVADATGWQRHTARGFFPGMKRRQGIDVEVLERVRQVGPGKEGARGSDSVYQIAEPAERRHGTAPRYAVGLYRVSTAEQGQSGLGLEAQAASVQAFVASQGWTLLAE
jgi:hypothetical protein